MEHEQVEKVLAGNCLHAVFSGFCMEVSVGNHGIDAIKNILLPDDTSIQVPAKINEGLIAIADVFAVNHPFIVVDNSQAGAGFRRKRLAKY